jgi:hypothetical protein
VANGADYLSGIDQRVHAYTLGWPQGRVRLSDRPFRRGMPENSFGRAPHQNGGYLKSPAGNAW